ncbi:hypothetical protein BH09SUM1_BH09SUM1_29230 [soil metagenome]
MIPVMLPTGSIRFENVTKTYLIDQKAAPRIGAWFLSKAFEYFRREPFHALNDVSLRVEPGEMIGLVGNNGAGKSTVLKLIAGISQPTTGTVTVAGKVTSLLELGVGFHPELTGMENIFYNGAIMGMARDQILQRLDTIITFSGLSEFLYEPVKHYSSGMYARLACSVALHLEPEIMLVDEILGVGDAEFQQRGMLKILDLHRKGVTILIVTHETATARNVCDRLLWIERGRMREEGDPQRIYENYMKAMLASVKRVGPFEPAAIAPGAGAKLDKIEFFVNGAAAQRIETDEAGELHMRVTGEAATVRIGLQWRWPDGRVISEDFSEPIALENGNAEAVYRIPRMPLTHTDAAVTVLILDGQSGAVLDLQRGALQVAVTTKDNPPDQYFSRMKATWTVS